MGLMLAHWYGISSLVVSVLLALIGAWFSMLGLPDGHKWNRDDTKNVSVFGGVCFAIGMVASALLYGFGQFVNAAF